MIIVKPNRMDSLCVTESSQDLVRRMVRFDSSDTDSQLKAFHLVVHELFSQQTQLTPIVDCKVLTLLSELTYDYI